MVFVYWHILCVIARCSFYPIVNKKYAKCCIITLHSVFVQGIWVLDTLPLYIYYELLMVFIVICIFKAMNSLSSFSNLVYYCNINDCINHVKTLSLNGLTNGTSEIKEMITSLMQQYLSSENSALQKQSLICYCRIDKLQAQELD